MPAPKSLRQYDATPDRKAAEQNRRVLKHVESLISDMLVAGKYGNVQLTLPVLDGILQGDMVVVYEHRIKL